MAEKDTTGGGMTGATGSNPEPSTTAGSLRDRLMQAVSPVLQGKNTTAGQNPEPVILEEHVVEKTPPIVEKAPPPVQSAMPKIVKPPTEVTAEDVGLVLPKPSLQSSVSLTPKPMTAPPAEPAKPVLPSSLSIPPLPDEAPVAPFAAVTKAPIQPAAPIAPSAPPEPITPIDNTPPSGDMNNDIQRILSQVKLPERRDQKGAADPKPVQQAPKDISAMVTKPPMDAESARAMEKPEANAISSVHTLKDDLQHVVKEKKMSLVRAVALEQDKKRDEIIEEEFGRKERRRRVSGILFASFLLFGLGFAALFGVYFVMMSHSGTNVQQLNSMVFAEQSVALPLDNSQPSELKRRVAVARQGQVGSLGSITRVVPIYQGADANAQPIPATTKQFFTAMGFNAPDDLVKALGDNFFFGLHVVDKNSPVLVISVSNYDRAFAGMLAWEATMNTDLSPAFTPVPTTILDANGIPSARIFQDDVMRNYDVRELKDDSGAVILYYSFPSKNILVIAESPYTFPEILSRLQSMQRL